jgi:hypothetical protein
MGRFGKGVSTGSLTFDDVLTKPLLMGEVSRTPLDIFSLDQGRID